MEKKEARLLYTNMDFNAHICSSNIPDNSCIINSAEEAKRMNFRFWNGMSAMDGIFIFDDGVTIELPYFKIKPVAYCRNKRCDETLYLKDITKKNILFGLIEDIARIIRNDADVIIDKKNVVPIIDDCVFLHPSNKFEDKRFMFGMLYFDMDCLSDIYIAERSWLQPEKIRLNMTFDIGHATIDVDGCEVRYRSIIEWIANNINKSEVAVKLLLDADF